MIRKLLYLSMMVVATLSCSATEYKGELFVSESDTLTVATFNVRIRTGSDKDERSWDYRKADVARLIHHWRFDIVGVQELIDSDQEKELSSMLPSFKVYSKGRDNTEGTKGERLAIYYHKDRFTLLKQGYFFLSQTPEIASKGWDASLNRMCQWIQLHDKITNQSLYIFNLHFDHIGKEARAQSAALVTGKIKEIAGNEKVICMGDFNANPDEIRVYQTLTKSLADSRTIAETVSGSIHGTFNGWNVVNSSFSEAVRIDYVFTNLKKIIEYRVITDTYNLVAYPSDHFPVMIRTVVN